MGKRNGRTVEVDSLDQFDTLMRRGAKRIRGWRLQGIDLRSRTTELRALEPQGALFLGVVLTDDDASWLVKRGALIFPEIPQLPFDPYRSNLYTPEELYAGIREDSYDHSPDAAIYAWSRQRRPSSEAALSKALHDHAIDGELDALLDGRRSVGVMGGHDLVRSGDAYAEAATLGRELTRAGMFVVTGGGPGAMEAANLGAYLAARPDPVIPSAVESLGADPSFKPSITAWARAAFAVRDRWPDGAQSLGIPTWHYGHEPPNAFATEVAKFFQNALREDTLLRRCNGGVVFLPGAGGTVQEIFQDACENYYADRSTVVSMVLVGKSYWTETLPAWPLLERLGRDRSMAARLHLVDSAAEAVERLAP